jgi:hypothetical protein
VSQSRRRLFFGLDADALDSRDRGLPHLLACPRRFPAGVFFSRKGNAMKLKVIVLWDKKTLADAIAALRAVEVEFMSFDTPAEFEVVENVLTKTCKAERVDRNFIDEDPSYVNYRDEEIAGEAEAMR